MSTHGGVEEAHIEEDSETAGSQTGKGGGNKKPEAKLLALKLRIFAGERKEYEEWRRELRAAARVRRP